MKKKDGKIEITVEEEKYDKEQSKRFVETVKSLDSDMSGELFKNAVNLIEKKTLKCSGYGQS